jgi:hypothetical protein
MAETTNVEQPIYDIKSPLDVSKINPVGSDVSDISEKKQAALDAQAKFAQSLENRYAQPNLFKVAAGFLKPQLGGFAASLGSASEALGSQVEQQRAIAPTIERMRAEVAAGQLGLSQRTEQERRLKELDQLGQNSPGYVTKLREIYSFDPNSPVGKSIERRPEFETSRRAETKFGIDVQKDVLANPAIIIQDPNYSYTNSTPEKAAEYKAKVNTAIPPGFTPQEWGAMAFPKREDAVAKYASDKSKEGMSEGNKFALQAGQSHDILDDVSDLRQLALDPSLKPVFSLFQNGDLFSQIRAAAAENPGKAQSAIEGLVAAKLAELKNVDEPTRAKADKLIKNIASLEVRLRGSLSNPTDQASFLSSQRSPTLGNSQTGFVGILDQIAFNSARDIGIAKLHNQLIKQGIPERDAAYSAAIENYRNETRDIKRQLAKGDYDLNKTPSWYDTRNQNAQPAEKAQSTTPASPAATSGKAKPALTPITADAIAAEMARRKAAQQTQ